MRRPDVLDIRHTHATILLADRENVKVVSERLGHASVTVTLSIYAKARELHQTGLVCLD
jgi:integrase